MLPFDEKEEDHQLLLASYDSLADRCRKAEARVEDLEHEALLNQDRCDQLEDALAVAGQQIVSSYVPQDVAMECLEMLKPLDRPGYPNTLWALVKRAMERISELETVIQNP